MSSRHEQSGASGEPKPAAACALCGQGRDLLRATSVGERTAGRLASLYPERWPSADFVCRPCLARERLAHVTEELRRERGELGEIEQEIARHAGEHLAIAGNLARQFAREITFGQRIADQMARVGGSWGFVIGFLAVLGCWIALNALLAYRAFDPYPYILLNLVLSCIAALQAPVIMMSQNRQAARDRMEAEEDFRVNLKAELEIASLHEKVDHLLHAQWERMVELQELQLELLAELSGQRARK
jgi:uncharacterized membrane protein